MESKYILKSLERLLPLGDKEGSWEDLLTVIENTIVSSQVDNHVDKWILNDDMVEILKVKSEQLADSAVFRFGEENKAMIDYASNTITSWAYGMLGYHSMRNLTKGKNQVEEEWNAAVQKYKGSINKGPKIKGAKFSSKNVTALKENSPVKNTIQRGPVIKGVKFSQRSGKNPEMKVEPEGNVDPSDSSKYPQTRRAVHEDLTGKGYYTTGTTDKGYIVYRDNSGHEVTIKPSGEVIPTTRMPKDPNNTSPKAPKYNQRTYYDGSPIPDELNDHTTGHNVGKINKDDFYPEPYKWDGDEASWMKEDE